MEAGDCAEAEVRGSLEQEEKGGQWREATVGRPWALRDSSTGPLGTLRSWEKIREGNTKEERNQLFRDASHGLWEGSHMGCPVLSGLYVQSPAAGHAVG